MPPLLNLLNFFPVLYHAQRCMKCFFDISNFLEENSSFSHSLVFLCFFALLIEEALLLLAIPWNFAFS